MEIISCNYIEIEESDMFWAIALDECKGLKHPAKPVKPLFIEVFNQIGDSIIVISNTLLSHIPEKIIDGVNGGIADDCAQVGFWRLKLKK